MSVSGRNVFFALGFLSILAMSVYAVQKIWFGAKPPNTPDSQPPPLAIASSLKPEPWRALNNHPQQSPPSSGEKMPIKNERESNAKVLAPSETVGVSDEKAPAADLSASNGSDGAEGAAVVFGSDVIDAREHALPSAREVRTLPVIHQGHKIRLTQFAGSYDTRTNDPKKPAKMGEE
ncbi:hypothetical protein FKG94_15820 [Exilibacterium tricleocarpae]|uniref:Uncharacterized protein n=1 Tax=Exilibacterium tricleocarpae TaxID=2591008 RepID=A0A545TFW8_9GAMM|nr:hypothetical protein [Exilibacterium tricleocarpae]TQV76076.1 hypothetical protein FKG94_15820 [Exilibacterium tricleocarpae]